MNNHSPKPNASNAGKVKSSGLISPSHGKK